MKNPALMPRLLSSGMYTVVLSLSTATLTVSMAAPASAASTASIIKKAIDHVAVSDSKLAPSVGTSGDAIVRVQNDRPAATIESDGRNIVISLDATQTTEGKLAGNSTTFQNVDEDTDAAVVATANGVQMLSVMHSASASTEQRYRLELPAGTDLYPTAEGGFLLVENQGDIVGTIEAPWAVDATGKRLPTGYKLEDNVLIQSTETKGATFPVVADPKVSYGVSIYVRYQKSEVKDFKQKGFFVGAAALTTAACVKIPVPWLVAACGASIAVVSESVLDTFESAGEKNRCVELQFNYQGIIKEWKTKGTGSWCK